MPKFSSDRGILHLICLSRNRHHAALAPATCGTSAISETQVVLNKRHPVQVVELMLIIKTDDASLKNKPVQIGGRGEHSLVILPLAGKDGEGEWEG